MDRMEKVKCVRRVVKRKICNDEAWKGKLWWGTPIYWHGGIKGNVLGFFEVPPKKRGGVFRRMQKGS